MMDADAGARCLLDGDQRRRLVASSADLEGLPTALLDAFADKAVAVRYPARHVFEDHAAPSAPVTVRLVVLGRVAMNWRTRESAVVVVPPGRVFGPRDLGIWQAIAAPSRVDPKGRHQGRTYALDPVWVLELDGKAIDALTRGPAGEPLRQRLAEIAARIQLAPMLVAALRLAPELTAVQSDALQRLARDASLEPYRRGDVVQEPDSTPTATLVTLSGRLSRSAAWPARSHVPIGDSGAVSCLPEMMLGRRMDEGLVCAEDAVVARIPVEAFQRVLRTSADFRRRFADPLVRLAPRATTPTWSARATVIAVGAAPELIGQLPLGRLGEALHQALVAHCADRVWTVRLVEAHDDADDQFPPTRIPLPRTDAAIGILADALTHLVDDLGPRWDAVVVDLSALVSHSKPGATDLQRRVVAALRHLRTGTTFSYLVQEPAQWHEVPRVLGAIDGVTVLPTVLLGPPRHDPKLARPFMDWVDDMMGATTLNGAIDQMAAEPASRVAAWWEATRSYWKSVATFCTDGFGTRPLDLDNAWPLDAVKLRIPDAALERLTTSASWTPVALLESVADGPDGHLEPRFARWARAVTGRRVGVSIGGGGALAYVGVPVLRDLHARGIPVDVVTGSSMGALVSAFYAARGLEGLEVLVRHWYWPQLTVLQAYVLGQPLQAWLDFDLGFADVSELEVNLVPVATQATDGREVLLSTGPVGQVVAASGAVPPMAPGYAGVQRLLDGALSAEIPIAASAIAGAAATIAVGVVPLPARLPDDTARRPGWLWSVLRSLDPVRRMADEVRGYNLLYRQAGGSQGSWADVTYDADTQGASGGSFYRVRDIVDHAEDSIELRFAIEKANQVWIDLLGHVPDRVRPWPDVDGTILVQTVRDGTPDFTHAAAMFDPRGALAPKQPFLDRVAVWMDAHPWAQVEIRVTPLVRDETSRKPARPSAGHAPMAVAVRDYLNGRLQERARPGDHRLRLAPGSRGTPQTHRVDVHLLSLPPVKAPSS